MLASFLNNLNLPIQLAFTTISSFLICTFCIKKFLHVIDKKQICRQPIRESGPKTHLENKVNTPTMGGLMIIISMVICSILFFDLTNSYIIITLFSLISFAIIGFIDDYQKVTRNHTNGFRGSFKLIIQFMIIGSVILALQYTDEIYFKSDIFIPFVNQSLDLGIFYILFATIVIVGCANSVNLTDGLDGLVSIPVVIALICLSIIIYITSDVNLSDKFFTTHIENISGLIIFCSCLIGCVLAFLKFNIKPAKIFMGDVGSLSIGATIGVMAIIVKQEIVFGIISLLFVIEALSVIIQVTSFKLFKKRVFLMSPIHHHFEKLGWSEKKVVRVFWLISLIFGIIGLQGIF